MTDKERTAMRKIQDKFLKLLIVKKFIGTRGEDYPLWEGGPTVSGVRSVIYPEWKSKFEQFLKENKHG